MSTLSSSSACTSSLVGASALSTRRASSLSVFDADALIGAILKERRIELHTEWGHRWLDLKRTDRATEVLEPLKDAWEPTDVLYPIPGDERMKNPNLSQNDGY